MKTELENEEAVRRLLESDDVHTSPGHDEQILSAARALGHERTRAQPVQLLPWILVKLGIERRWAVAASIAVISIAAGLAWVARDQRQQLSAWEAERQALGATVADLQEQVTQLQQERQALQQELERARVADSRPASGQRPDPEPLLLASAVLTPGLVRGDDELPKVKLPAKDGMLRLELDLATVAQHSTYRAELLTAAGKQVWSKPTLKASSTEWGRMLAIELPSELLVSAEYELVIGRSSDATLDDPTYYYFEVQRQ